MLLLFTFVIILMNVSLSKCGDGITEDFNYDTVSASDIESLKEEFLTCCKDLKSQALNHENLINDFRTIIKSEMESMKNQLYEEFSNKIKEELVDLKSKQAENGNLVKYTRNGLSNLTSELNSVSKGADSAIKEFRSTTKEMKNDINNILVELNRTASHLVLDLSTRNEPDQTENITRNIKTMSSRFNESIETIHAQLEKINLNIINNTISFEKTNEEIKDLQIKVNDIQNSSTQTFYLANTFSEMGSTYECAEYETFRTKIESSVVEVAKTCSNADTVRRLNDLKSYIKSNTELMNNTMQQNLKYRTTMQNDQDQSNTDKVIAAVKKLETNIKDKLVKQDNKRLISAISQTENNLKEHLYRNINGNSSLKLQMDNLVQITSATNDLLTPKPIAKRCKNSKWENAPGDMNVCKEVVKNQMCKNNLKLAFHCCKSCTRAKQLNKDGPHRYLNEPRRIDYIDVILS
ncbi:unnamed protein product [Meganyctiphanes norvegica]|uniref:ShKT domain-containing protein n=1 Tax=Meganyctiphanes norvegica TaxID=48144 RepID=A0AAV2RK98_MEGNR